MLLLTDLDMCIFQTARMYVIVQLENDGSKLGRLHISLLVWLVGRVSIACIEVYLTALYDLLGLFLPKMYPTLLS